MLLVGQSSFGRGYLTLASNKGNRYAVVVDSAVDFAAAKKSASDLQYLLRRAFAESDYVIVIPAQATEMERKAASEFRRLLELSSSVELPIVTDAEPAVGKEILIGRTSRRQSLCKADLHEDGFRIRTSRRKLSICGGSQKGVLYGVYTFFDRYLGYRCYSPSVFRYPIPEKIRVASGIDDTQIPVNTYRNVYYHVADDPFYADWHKLDHMKPDWGLWVHTFSQLVPAEKYFASHPEYFALVDGKRTARQADGHLEAQLCLSNPDVLEVVVENLRKRMDEQPDALYWSVSQNDTYADRSYRCTCPECAALDSVAGAPSGSIVSFVNKVAARFPDKIVSTLAYRSGRTAPQDIVPADNVNIMLCDIECDRHRPVETDPASASFRRDFEQWGRIANNILMWDYIVQFSNLMAPFPNLRTLQPNMQYFVRNGVTAHFQQGNISRGGEFSELKPYLVARLLWNPDADIEAEMADFLSGYYEDAAPYIARYIDSMHDELEASGLPLTIYGKPYDHFENGFLRPEAVARYESFFDAAERAVASKPEVLERVRTARLPLTFSLLEIAKVRGTADLRVFERTADGWRVRPEIEAKLDAFRDLCNRVGVEHFVEGAISPDEYWQRTRDAFAAIVRP